MRIEVVSGWLACCALAACAGSTSKTAAPTGPATESDVVFADDKLVATAPTGDPGGAADVSHRDDPCGADEATLAGGTAEALGHGAGTGEGQGFSTSAPVVSGRLPPEAIQRIVRQHFYSFRVCYQNGLRSNPNLQGRVAVRFVIGRDGAVSSATNGGSDMPDSSVVSCTVRAFNGLTFPQPQGGIVTVTYPIAYAPG